MSNSLSPAIDNSLNFKFGQASEPSLSTKNTQKQQSDFLLKRIESNAKSVDKSSLMDELSVIEHSLQLFGSARLSKPSQPQKKQPLRVGILPEFFDPDDINLNKTLKPLSSSYLKGTQAKRSCKEAIVISTSNIYY
mmetsp:Transcript_25007/g.38827  ORF Transcript_25007/g.38827 Transcript_25007/m.38827 type:complete len:136 (+) Transcript_25007:85-492(+)